MDSLIRNGSVITGDGKTYLERADIYLQGGKISAVIEGGANGSADPVAAEIIDAEGCVIIPGVINAHAHGCIHGPSMPSGSVPMGKDDVEYYRNRHLLEGTTTLLNVCGLAFPNEIDLDSQKKHPLDVQISTAHTKSNVLAALQIDGAGLSEKHKNATIDELLVAGAKALGEVGGGQTLGGGAQEYKFIPLAVKRETGIDIHPNVARVLKKAIVGPYLDETGAVSDDELDALLAEHGLDSVMNAQRAREIVKGSVLPPVSLALQGFEEVAAQSARVKYPAVFHNASPTAKLLVKLAEQYPEATIVAGHSNHSMFSAEDAVHFAGELRKRGAKVDISTLDCIETRWRNDPSNIDALIDAGYVDTISTDFAGSHWDGILKAIHRIINRKQMSAPAAVALATGNVAKIFPQLAGDRGFIERGKRADLVIADRVNIGRVKHVLIKGEMVVRNGAIVQPNPRSR
jgi:hypothetical protein